jgi:hypothetical protein
MTMSVEVITKDDLQAFRVQLISDLKQIFTPPQRMEAEWLRSSDVRKLLRISPGTLQGLRINGKLKSSKVGGVHFYRYSDLEKLLTGSEGKG